MIVEALNLFGDLVSVKSLMVDVFFFDCLQFFHLFQKLVLSFHLQIYDLVLEAVEGILYPRLVPRFETIEVAF